MKENSEKDTNSRIKNVLNYKKPAFWMVAAALVVCIVLAACLIANPQNAKKLSLPAFNGNVSTFYNSGTIDAKNLIPVSEDEWSKAKDETIEQSKSQSGSAENVMTELLSSLSLSDFSISTSLRGTLNRQDFQLDTYGYDGELSIIVSTYGEKKTVIASLNHPLSPKVLYGNSVWLTDAKGFARNFDIAAGELGPMGLDDGAQIAKDYPQFQNNPYILYDIIDEANKIGFVPENQFKCEGNNILMLSDGLLQVK